MTSELYELLRTRGDGTPYFATCVWPGGWPVLYQDCHGETLCAHCATVELWGEYPAIGYCIYFEGPPEYCAQCGLEIESAYGDPEENT